MGYFLRILFFFFITSFGLSQKKDWNSTTFDYYWNKVIGNMQFREPVQSSPLEIRMGYYSYGTSSYWDQPFSISNNLDYMPLHLDSTNTSFSQIANSSNRSGLLFEIDFLRFNAGDKIIKQNYLDWQIGFGYKYFNLLKRVKLPNYWQIEELVEQNGTYYFRPKIHDINVNYTLIFQPLDFLLLSWYHSLGYSAGYIYETDSDVSYLFAKGISESFSLGLKIPLSAGSSNYNFIYGLEYKWNRSYLWGNLTGKNHPANINNVDLYSNGLFFTFGLQFGGYKTKGDKAFEKMLTKNYGAASNLFEEFLIEYPDHSKTKRAEKMLKFCKSQIPYENIEKTIANLKYNNLDMAISNLLEAEEYNIPELSREIETRKDDIARMLVDDILENADTLDFITAETMASRAYNLSPNNLFVKNIRSQMYLKKADFLIENGDYFSSVDNLKQAINIFPENIKFYNSKIMEISILMMDEVNKSFNDGNYIVAINTLSKISDINPSLNDKASKAINNLKQKLENRESKKINKLISNMAEKYKKEKDNMEIKINLGMTYYEVREAIGEPNIIDKKIRFDSNYQMWTYFLDSKSKRYYFEDHLLTKIE